MGAGATGVELAGAIGEIARQTLKHDFRSIHPEEAEIILLDGAPRVLMPFPEDLAEKAARSLAKLGVQVKTGVMVKDIDRDGVTIETQSGTDRLNARTVIWAGGVTASALGRTWRSAPTPRRTGADGSRSIPTLPVPSIPTSTWSATWPWPWANGKPLPGVAQVAMQQGTYAAQAIVRKLQGETAIPPFQYFDKGDMAVIGRWAAVANIFGVHVSGLPAWLVWAFIHLMYLVQFQSRLLVFIQWAIQDLTFSRGARLITGAAATDFDFTKAMASEESGRAAGALRQSPAPGKL